MKKLLSVLLSICLIFQLVVPVFAAEDTAEITASGTCGDGVSWFLISDGTLMITGSGEMSDYASGSAAPWAGMTVTGVAVDEGVTYMGKNAFAACPDMSAVIFFGKAPAFSAGTFNGVTAMAVYIPDSSWTDSVMQNYGGTVYWVPGITEVPTITKIWAPYDDQLNIVINEVPYAVGYAFYRRPANVEGSEFELIGVDEADGDDTAVFAHRTGVPGTKYEYKATSIGILGIESDMSDAKTGTFAAAEQSADLAELGLAASWMGTFSSIFGFYGEGETPSAELMRYGTEQLSGWNRFREYEVGSGESTHEIPRAAFEEVAFTYFPYSTAAVEELRNSATYSADTECYYFFGEFDLSNDSYFYLNYEKLGDNLYQFNGWQIQTKNDDDTAYEPAEGDDYVMWSGAPAKITGDIITKVQYVNGRPMFLCNELREHEPHEHVLTKVDAMEPNCWYAGCVDHYSCYCNRAFADAEGKEPIADAILPQLQHVEQIIPAVNPTCTSPGYTQGKKCALCGLQMVAPIPLSKLAHSTVYIPDAEPTCTSTGSHGGTMCSVCGKTLREPTVIPKLPHTYVDGVCTVCGKEYAPSITGVNRIYGADRYETAFRTAEVLKAQLGVERFDNIVVACGDNFADALGGSYLAAKKNAPILLVKSDKVDAVKDYIRANLNPGGTVYLLGGIAAIPSVMDLDLDEFRVMRLAGIDRYDTNLRILKEASVGGEDILICTGTNFADSLSAAAAGRPILLVKGSLSDKQKEFLFSTAGNQKYILGGTAAVSADVENQVKAYGAVERIGGSTRYETSVLIAEKFFPEATQAVLAYAQNFPDGLSGGALAYTMDAPLVLTASGKEAAAAAYAKEQGITSGVILGGPGLISDKAVRTIFQMKSGDTIIVK